MFRAIATAGLSLLIAGSAAAQGRNDDVVRRLGKTVVQYKDEAVQVVVGYRHANSNFPSEWMVLQLDVSATGGKPIEIDREDVALVLPGGQRISLPSQKALAEGLRDVARVVKQLEVQSDPLDSYFTATRFERIGFFVVPGEDVVLDRFSVSRDRLGKGLLFFRAPEGKKFEPGVYKLEIFNRDVDVKLPFPLPASEWKKGKAGDDKTVPW